MGHIGIDDSGICQWSLYFPNFGVAQHHLLDGNILVNSGLTSQEWWCLWRYQEPWPCQVWRKEQRAEIGTAAGFRAARHDGLRSPTDGIAHLSHPNSMFSSRIASLTSTPSQWAFNFWPCFSIIFPYLPIVCHDFSISLPRAMRPGSCEAKGSIASTSCEKNWTGSDRKPAPRWRISADLDHLEIFW